MRNQEHEPVYVISVAARLAGLPCWVLRVLDQEGIVVPVRTDSNRRLYSDRDISLLARVRHLTEDRGVNIQGVKVILEMERERAEAATTADTTEATEPTHPPITDTTSAMALAPYSVPSPSQGH